jgi:nucleoside-diphosphate-sugar epimerase
MAIQKFLTAIKKDEPIYVTGDGSQKRDLTYVGDVVAATISALGLIDKKQIFNISGGFQYTLNQIVEQCFAVLQKQTRINYLDRPLGDQEETFGDNSKAKKMLNFNPKINLEAGLQSQSASLS